MNGNTAIKIAIVMYIIGLCFICNIADECFAYNDTTIMFWAIVSSFGGMILILLKKLK